MTQATPADTELLIAMMRELWETSPDPFDEARSRTHLAALFADPSLGRVYLLGETAGYLVLTFGFSLEYGRDAFIDEFFIAAPHRNRGLGGATLDRLALLASSQGIEALHLEADDANHAAQSLYLRKGFIGNSRRLMTRWLSQIASPRDFPA